MVSKPILKGDIFKVKKFYMSYIFYGLAFKKLETATGALLQ